MRRVTVRVPVRADLAGGTLDLWPLYLFHPGSRTVNVAISYHAECEVSQIPGSEIEIFLTDQQYHQRYATIQELSHDPKASLVARAVEHFKVTGVKIVTRTTAPRGSGLGGSSALAVALVRALSSIAEDPKEGDGLIALVRDLETRLIKVPAGIQDYYPPVYGGLAALYLEPGGVYHRPISLSLQDLSDHFVLHYSEVSHFSGTNNWEIYKRQIDGDRKVHDALDAICASAIDMEQALVRQDMKAAGKALALEWRNRKALIKGVSTPEIDRAIDLAKKAGAWGGKVCGAGGGGCIVFLVPPEKKKHVLEALTQAPGRPVDAVPVAQGLDVDERGAGQSAFSFVNRRSPRPSDVSVEQLYLASQEMSVFNPFVMAEAAVTFSESRSGIRIDTMCAYVAPVDTVPGRVDWQSAIRIVPDELELSAVPNAAIRQHGISEATLMNATSEGEESFKQFVEQAEKLSIYFNPPFGMYSEANESRSAFVDRCMDESRRRLQDETERLESTFSRRIDQMRERAEKDQRELQEERPLEMARHEIDIAWGQMLYNITSGKPPSSQKPQSPEEAEYMEKISKLQKLWERERDELSDDLTQKARSIEELQLPPSAQTVELVKYVIVWAPSLASFSQPKESGVGSREG